MGCLKNLQLPKEGALHALDDGILGSQHRV